MINLMGGISLLSIHPVKEAQIAQSTKKIGIGKATL